MAYTILTFMQLMRKDAEVREFKYWAGSFEEEDTGWRTANKPWCGVFSNEAPVKYLLDKCRERGESEVALICLNSAETLNLTEGVDNLAYFYRETDAEGRSVLYKVYYDKQSRGYCYKDRDGKTVPADLTECVFKTSYEYYRERIEEYAGSSGSAVRIRWESIQYSVSNAEQCISALIDLLKNTPEGTRSVGIDITSGQRTLPYNIFLCLESLVNQRIIHLTDMVYARLGSGERPDDRNEIREETHIAGLIDLINGVNSFTAHGKSEDLEKCLENTSVTEISELVRSIRVFSDKLLICRIMGITEDVDRIHEALNTAERLTRISMPSGLRTRERVFLHLIPTIRKNFVAVGDAAGKTKEQIEAEKTLSLIQWCVDHGMLQQALSIYRENVAEILADTKLVAMGEVFSANYEARRAAKKYASNIKIDEHSQPEAYWFDRLYRFKKTYLKLEKDGPSLSAGEVIQWETEGLRDILRTMRKDYSEKCTVVDASGKPMELLQGDGIKYRFNSVFEDGGGSLNPEDLRPNTEAICVLGDLGISICMSNEHFCDCLTYAYYLQFIRNAVMHAGTFDLNLGNKFKNDSLPTYRPEQPELPSAEADALTVDNIRTALREAVAVIREALEDPARERYPEMQKKEYDDALKAMAEAEAWRTAAIGEAWGQICALEGANTTVLLRKNENEDVVPEPESIPEIAQILEKLKEKIGGTGDIRFSLKANPKTFAARFPEGGKPVEISITLEPDRDKHRVKLKPAENSPAAASGSV